MFLLLNSLVYSLGQGQSNYLTFVLKPLSVFVADFILESSREKSAANINPPTIYFKFEKL